MQDLVKMKMSAFNITFVTGNKMPVIDPLISLAEQRLRYLEMNQDIHTIPNFPIKQIVQNRINFIYHIEKRGFTINHRAKILN